ncbi:aldehyde dehydrogenase (NAD+) [Paenibacillus endophyticus]|uniref:Aldehyde dehydrogenase n=1 Tax=Paenibacillus endophyticus TaxID=1294268 RepID=A0A7W5CA37_9BACL|nr:aldehyde dehydrogenase [Paenibacillus endophyticus]MBB3153936.1 aldehyde dehydrogenase (NAD+) [Paenibacillus endophyticus]
MHAAGSEDIESIIQAQKAFFEKGTTKDLQFRLQQLGLLKQAIKRYEKEIVDALYQDLRKSELETYMTEIIIATNSITHTMKQLKKWIKPQKVKTPLYLFPSSSRIVKEPYGTILIIGPFNYPFQLVIEPLIGAIAAGNCAIVKPSENTPRISALIQHLLNETFEPAYIKVIEGERETTSLLIHAPVDYIFFTGSIGVGKIVMEAAAKRLVPVTLELGGKSPVIVDSSANLELAAKRIIWGKCLNTGQTCISPDYLLVHESVKAPLLSKMKKVITSFYGSDIQRNKDYGRIVNRRQFDRLAAILEKDQASIAFGGRTDAADLFIEPTLLDGITWESEAMSDEIFGPILPIMTYRHIDEAVRAINARPKPLSLYLFTESKPLEHEVMNRISFGGGCINDTILHASNPHLPFGGVGTSGVGAYHGKHSFDVFSHRKSILKKSGKFELGLVFPPYDGKLERLKKLLK